MGPSRALGNHESRWTSLDEVLTSNSGKSGIFLCAIILNLSRVLQKSEQKPFSYLMQKGIYGEIHEAVKTVTASCQSAGIKYLLHSPPPPDRLPVDRVVKPLLLCNGHGKDPVGLARLVDVEGSKLNGRERSGEGKEGRDDLSPFPSRTRPHVLQY